MPGMRTSRVIPGTRTDRWAHGLYTRAFPPQERIAWPLVHLLCLRRGVDLVAWYDEPGRAARPVALTWTVRRPGERLVYLFYLAVDESARGHGTGGRLLAELRSRFPGASVVLDIEPVVPEASNAEQRRRRLAFYERAGFRDTGLELTDVTGSYWSLVREEPGAPWDPEAYWRALRHLGLGVSSLRLEPRDPGEGR